jgi:hypothetical protein
MHRVVLGYRTIEPKEVIIQHFLAQQLNISTALRLNS